ncbi:MAG: methyltransferase domain-containing protein [Pseudomonadota bacterium]
MELANADQHEFWSRSPSGQKWLTYEDHLDAAMAPVLDGVIARADLQPGYRVLDIGCGTGASLLAAAERVGAHGAVLGLDISQPFLDRAEDRARNAGFGQVATRCADAQTDKFDGPQFDTMISRFGVMFFNDPQTAFANMARALRPGAKMTFAAWSSFAQNPWFRLPHETAASRLGNPPPADPHAPGPLAFQDADRVLGLLDGAGLKNTGYETEQLHMTPQGTPQDIASLCLRVGPAARLIGLFDASRADRQAIQADLTARLSNYETADGVKVPAEIHFFQASVP